MPWSVGHARIIIAKYNEYMALAFLLATPRILVGFILHNNQIIPNHYLYGFSQKRRGLPH